LKAQLEWERKKKEKEEKAYMKEIAYGMGKGIKGSEGGLPSEMRQRQKQALSAPKRNHLRKSLWDRIPSFHPVVR
jgi:hypothetical protein